jgi:hypothetical protein
VGEFANVQENFGIEGILHHASKSHQRARSDVLDIHIVQGGHLCGGREKGNQIQIFSENKRKLYLNLFFKNKKEEEAVRQEEDYFR